MIGSEKIKENTGTKVVSWPTPVLFVRIAAGGGFEHDIRTKGTQRRRRRVHAKHQCFDEELHPGVSDRLQRVGAAEMNGSGDTD